MKKRCNRQRGVLFMDDNARPGIANMTKVVIQTHGWEVLPYSPELTRTDFHLFRSLSNAMREASFNTSAELRVWLNTVIFLN